MHRELLINDGDIPSRSQKVESRVAETSALHFCERAPRDLISLGRLSIAFQRRSLVRVRVLDHLHTPPCNN